MDSPGRSLVGRVEWATLWEDVGPLDIRTLTRKWHSMDQPLDLRDYLAILWGRKGTILAIAATTTAVALAYSLTQTPVYTSSAEVLVLSSSFAASESSEAFTALNMTTEEQVANSLAVADLASDRLASKGVAPGTVSASRVEDANTLVFTSESSHPRAAKATAQAYAGVYLELRRSNFLSELEGARQPLELQIDVLDAELQQVAEALQTAEEGERELLAARYSSLLSERVSVITRLNDFVAPESVEVGRILRSADLPESPSSPNHMRDGLLGVVVGLALGMGVAFFRERLDEPVRGQEELEAHAGASVLGFIPSAGWERSLRTRGHVTEEAAEAFRALRVRLLHARGDRDIKSVVITSSLAGEGKTSVTTNLAVALALAGNRVVIVAADLRRPRLQTYFQGAGGEGVSEVVTGTSQPQIAITTTDTENLWVVHAGREAESLDPSEYLGSESMSGLLKQLRDFADFVLIDTPPLLPTSDVVALAPLTDGVLLVVDPHLARRSTLEQARHELELIDVPVLGVVVNKHDPSQFRGYGFGYAYYGDDHHQGSDIAPSRRLRAIPADSEDGALLPSDERDTGDLSQP
jgi:capsular exopolysaccharide synthesis family protein